MPRFSLFIARGEAPARSWAFLVFCTETTKRNGTTATCKAFKGNTLGAQNAAPLPRIPQAWPPSRRAAGVCFSGHAADGYRCSMNSRHSPTGRLRLGLIELAADTLSTVASAVRQRVFKDDLQRQAFGGRALLSTFQHNGMLGIARPRRTSAVWSIRSCKRCKITFALNVLSPASDSCFLPRKRQLLKTASGARSELEVDRDTSSRPSPATLHTPKSRARQPTRTRPPPPASHGLRDSAVLFKSEISSTSYLRIDQRKFTRIFRYRVCSKVTVKFRMRAKMRSQCEM